jgi:hypothetical protein
MPTITQNDPQTINENFPIPYFRANEVIPIFYRNLHEYANFYTTSLRFLQEGDFYSSSRFTHAKVEVLSYFKPENRLTVMVPTETFDIPNSSRWGDPNYRGSITYSKNGNYTKNRITNLPYVDVGGGRSVPSWYFNDIPFEDNWDRSASGGSVVGARLDFVRFPGLGAFAISPTISQYPRPGKVQLGSDNNISFGGPGWTYTMDMGPYVDLKSSVNYVLYSEILWSGSYIHGEQAPYSNYMFARAGDPRNFQITTPPNEPVTFEIRKIDRDVRGWAGWYLWTDRQLKQGDTLTFESPACAPRSRDDRNTPLYVKYTETRFGKTTGGVRYAPVTDAFGSTWTLQHV